MSGAGHLGHCFACVKRFMGFYTVGDPQKASVPLQCMTEAADRAAMDEVFSLGRPDDALNHVAVDQDMLRHLLVEKPKATAAGSQAASGQGEAPAQWRVLRLARGPLQQPLCKFKPECAKCGSKSHRSGECDQAKRAQ